ncbi:MAG: methyltransferase [Eubacteriales bacterium]|nr:methyltransferase [Eubacteriales bacterium]
MFTWTKEMIEYYDREEKYDSYNRELSLFLYHFIKEKKTILDVGCGVGLLSINFEEYNFNVDMVDISKEAIDFVKEKIKERKLKNTKAFIANIKNTSKIKNKYDILIFSHFGKMEDIIKISKKYLNANGRIIVLQKNYLQRRFSIQNSLYICNSAKESIEYLQMKKIKFDSYDYSFKQKIPFMNIQDANKFFNIYSNNTFIKTKESIKKLTTETKINSQTKNSYSKEKSEKLVLEKIKKIKNKQYEYVYKSKKDIKIIIIQGESIK